MKAQPCAWIHGCRKAAEKLVVTTILGNVPVCGRCADMIGKLSTRPMVFLPLDGETYDGPARLVSWRANHPEPE